MNLIRSPPGFEPVSIFNTIILCNSRPTVFGQRLEHLHSLDRNISISTKSISLQNLKQTVSCVNELLIKIEDHFSKWFNYNLFTWVLCLSNILSILFLANLNFFRRGNLLKFGKDFSCNKIRLPTKCTKQYISTIAKGS